MMHAPTQAIIAMLVYDSVSTLSTEVEKFWKAKISVFNRPGGLW